MLSPNLTNWTKTHGGPYYVEVGKNIEIKYHSKENVTINNTIIAPTSQTSNTTTSPDNTTTTTDNSTNSTD